MVFKLFKHLKPRVFKTHTTALIIGLNDGRSVTLSSFNTFCFNPSLCCYKLFIANCAICRYNTHCAVVKVSI